MFSSILLFLFLFWTQQDKAVFAQKLSLSITPPLLEVQIQPGKSLTQAYQISNNSETELVLKAEVVPFEPADEEGGVKFREVFEPKIGFLLQNADLRLGQSFLLRPGESKQLVLKIRVPKNAPEKDEYYTFLISQVPKTLLGESASQALVRIGSHILVSISKEERLARKGRVVKFEARPKVADVFSKVNFDMIAENTGNRYFKPEAELKIEGWGRGVVEELKIRPDNILAFSKRRLSCWLPKEDVSFETKECDFSSRIPGRYKAVLSFKPAGSEQPPQTYVVYFWILPLKLLLVLLLFVLVVGWARKAAVAKPL